MFDSDAPTQKHCKNCYKQHAKKRIRQQLEGRIEKCAEAHVKEQCETHTKQCAKAHAEEGTLTRYPRGEWQAVGIDEVGRGCLAGPVLAVALMWVGPLCPRGLRDSKCLSPSIREAKDIEIRMHAYIGFGWASVQEIDRDNILQASLKAMERAYDHLRRLLPVQPSRVLVDGPHAPRVSSHIPVMPIIKGDQRISCISAASIVAKVARDLWMRQQSAQYAPYGFAINKGYGTKDHRCALETWGPTCLHRRSFAPVSKMGS